MYPPVYSSNATTISSAMSVWPADIEDDDEDDAEDEEEEEDPVPTPSLYLLQKKYPPVEAS